MPKALMCSPELLNRDLSGRRYVVTGANGGIGLVSARQLAKQGAEVIMACRRVAEGEKQASVVRDEFPGAKVEVRKLDLGNLASVRKFAESFDAEFGDLHGLLNNAGVMNTPQSTTADGFEMQFGVNHLGHFLLTELLTPALERGAPSRIVNVSSCFHDKAMGREGKIHFEDLNYESRKYDGWEAYAQSKLANLLHAKGLAKRLADRGVTAVSVHPGWVRTDLMRHSMPSFIQNYIARPFLKMAGMIEPWEGAQTSLHALLADDVGQHAGAFYSQTGTYRDSSLNKGGWPLRSPNPVAHDEAAVDRLFDRSRELVGLA
jgi:NAD(P)-dependent dehydrogenase (short-subunit alcohol dehydrogenase family)